MIASSLATVFPNGITLHVGVGMPTIVAYLTTVLLKLSGFSALVRVTGQYRLGYICRCFADPNLAGRDMGFKHKGSLECRLRGFCTWAGTKSVHKDRPGRGEAELKERGLVN